ncbi:MAG: hypothetical protein J0M15_07100 [Deltaproteobacteria bacterium]|jgi:hypothetical protein|nr:hypothetical protein [Deltaproteobacteria bacterium]
MFDVITTTGNDFMRYFLFILLVGFTSRGEEFTELTFRKLAFELVSDIENYYGFDYSDQSVVFSTEVYRNIISQTKIELSEKPLVNYYEESVNGETKRLKESPDAINYFPKTNYIIIYRPAWEKKLKNKEFFSLKLMIHHEFVPYFINKMDRTFLFNEKIKRIYERPVTFDDFVDGFYEPIYYGNSLMSALIKPFLYHIKVEKSLSLIQIDIVENPKLNIWCLDCYLYPSLILKVPTITSQIVKMTDSAIKLSIGNFIDSDNGVVYLKINSSQVLSIAALKEDEVKKFSSQSMDEKLDTTLMVLKRVKNLNNVTWLKPKNLNFSGFHFSNGNDCDEVKRSEIKKAAEICRDYFKRIPDFFNESHCNHIEPKIENLTGLPAYKKYSCGFILELTIPTFNSFSPKGALYYSLVLDRWNQFLRNYNEKSP